MTFRTSLSRPTRVISHAGNPVQAVRSAKIDSKGNMTLVKVGEHDLYAEIQSYKDSCDIHLILKRFAAGDTEALARMQGFYADYADMPSTYAEVLNAVIAGEQSFNALPAEVKARFDNSFSVWLSSMEDADFGKKMSLDGISPDNYIGEALPPDPMSTASPVSPPAQTEITPVSSPGALTT